MSSRKVLAWALAALVLTGVNAMAAEKPQYEVLVSTDAYEIRHYEPYIVAETVVEGTYATAGNKAFNILAGYIFGNNKTSEKMAMTAPVESRAARDSVTMNMTAPVISSASSTDIGFYTYAFVMERKYTLETLPVPNDPRVRIRSVPERTVAVHRYSGSWSKENYAEHERLLLGALDDDGISTLGTPVSARYNAPFTPWFLRRNEVMIEIQDFEQVATGD
ncbi:MAG: heme-binding protein [Gammaproteobacteria bacterium]|nr:heme-binding protein [Gammaproteobacteria bacterium]MDH5215050.1 heme-binding protein [Gammaproteobacteria bacterium]